MGKCKKKNLSDKIHSKKLATGQVKKLNPFEVHINKEKLSVLGRKTKNDRGLPGVSRAKALKKRKNTLLQEYKQLNKNNKFNDRRIGENRKGMSEDDKIMARFAAIKRKGHKKSIFNLADDEVLTHKGQSLSEIEKFEDPRSDDDDDDLGGEGNLGADFVDEAHFGGGVLKRTQNEGYKTHKELIDELIAESKKRKAEKQKIKEATLELTEKLDTEWKDLLPIVSKSKSNAKATDVDEPPAEKPKVDDYDKIMRELKFEARGTVSDRLKSEDEIALEEKEKLERMEQERLERMRGFTDEKQKKSHRSADDLDDDFVYEADEEYALTYNEEGEANVEIEAEINGKLIGKEKDESGGEEEEEEEEDDQNEDEDSGSEDEADDLSDLKAETSESEEEEQEEETKKMGEEEEEEKEKEADNIEEAGNKDKEANSNEEEEEEEEEETNKEEIIENLLKRKEIMEKAEKQLPFTFTIPESFEDLQKLLERYESHEQGIVIERMIKCNHPSLAERNKENLNILFAYLLQYLNDLAVEASDENLVKKCFDVFQNLVPALYDLAQLSPENAHNSIREVIKEKHDEFKKNKKRYPDLEMLLLFKIVGLFFTTSDFRHQVVTPCFIFMGQILTNPKVITRTNIAYGLFIITLILEYTTLSKRFLPEAITYLGGLLHMAIPKSRVKLIKVQHPFRPTNSHLVLINKCEDSFTENELKMKITDLVKAEIDGNFKIRALYTTLELIEDFDKNLENIPSNVELFYFINEYLKQIPPENYPDFVKTKMEFVLKQLENREQERQLLYIVREKNRPKALRLYEPKIEEVFDYKKRKVQSKEKAERDKLLHKLKKETKGALREIRRDRDFLARVKIQQRIDSDKEREEKVKRIYSEAAVQQHELNSLDRNNKKKKK